MTTLPTCPGCIRSQTAFFHHIIQSSTLPYRGWRCALPISCACPCVMQDDRENQSPGGSPGLSSCAGAVVPYKVRSHFQGPSLQPLIVHFSSAALHWPLVCEARILILLKHILSAGVGYRV